ncbi:MAG: alpha/beta hydrolase [Gammaproteobacteria bacterium]|nr:alpha/beta hydrolase [Gammaproteobacteria bacterium]MYF02316.1 alpha/beta hydrolase [Gammaproteobacteria bacterium]
MHWTVPKPHSECKVVLDDGTYIVVRQHGNLSGPRLLMCHGNGLAIDLYYPFWSHFESDYEVLVYDLRNHGWNERTHENDHNIVSMVCDVDAILDETSKKFGAKPTFGIYHSLSALIALLYSSQIFSTILTRQNSGFDGLILFDPPVYPSGPGESSEEFDHAVQTATARTKKRTEHFESHAQFVELMNFLPAFSRLVPGATELMAQSILRKCKDGGYQLRCPREYEARLTRFARTFAGQINFDEPPHPIKVVGADPVLPSSYLLTVDLSDMISVDFDFVADATHYMQIEKPELCAWYADDFITKVSSANH